MYTVYVGAVSPGNGRIVEINDIVDLVNNGIFFFGWDSPTNKEYSRNHTDVDLIIKKKKKP